MYSDGAFYLGVFKSSKTEDESCSYSEVEGLGLSVGITRISVGAGYFDRKVLRVDPDISFHCSSAIADVYIGEAADEKSNSMRN